MSVQPAGTPDGEPHAEDHNPTRIACDLDTTPNTDVRDLARTLLTGRNDLLVEDAVLVADELVSNGHRHCRLALLDSGDRLRIEVDDASSNQPLIRTPASSGGRGLILVDRLSSRWGVHHHVHHKTVWAELALDRPASSGHTPHIAAASNQR